VLVVVVGGRLVVVGGRLVVVGGRLVVVGGRLVVGTTVVAGLGAVVVLRSAARTVVVDESCGSPAPQIV
jgi:hypothetical protein